VFPALLSFAMEPSRGVVEIPTLGGVGISLLSLPLVVVAWRVLTSSRIDSRSGWCSRGGIVR
jgi:hypothetical protein